MVGVKRSVDDGGNHAFRVVLAQRLFHDALAGTGISHDHTQAALLAVDAQGIENLLLLGQQSEPLSTEGVLVEAKVSADHFVPSFRVGRRGERALFLPPVVGFRSLAMASRGRASPMRSPLKKTTTRPKRARSKRTWTLRERRSRGASKRVFLSEKVLSASTVRSCSTKNNSSLASFGGKKRRRPRSRPKRSMGRILSTEC